MDLVHVKTTFNNGVLNIIGTLDSHYATDLEWTIDNAKVYSFEYINGESQFVQIITTTEIDTTNPAQVKILIKGLENKIKINWNCRRLHRCLHHCGRPSLGISPSSCRNTISCISPSRRYVTFTSSQPSGRHGLNCNCPSRS